MLTDPTADTPGSAPPAGGIPPGTEHWIGTRRLADEHAILLHEVRLRVGAVRATLGAGLWPDREVDRLVAYVRYEVLDQTTSEESLLFQLAYDGHKNSQISRLVDDHAHLRELADQLAAASTAVSEPREPQALVDLLDDLEDLLD